MRVIAALNRTAVAVIVLAAVTLGLPAPAGADPAGLEVRGSTTASTLLDKTATALCPAGKVASGGGGYLTASPGANGLVALDRLEPLAGGAGFRAGMRNVGVPPSWQLTAQAVCVPPPSGYQIVAVTGVVEDEYVTADCGQKMVIGMGGRINNGNGDVVLDQVVPSFTLDTVTVRGVRVKGTDLFGWTVTAFAICANSVPGIERIHLATFYSADDNKTVVTGCPAGKALYSAGGDVDAADGAAFLSGIHIAPTDTVHVWADGDDASWRVHAYGICGS